MNAQQPTPGLVLRALPEARTTGRTRSQGPSSGVRAILTAAICLTALLGAGRWLPACLAEQPSAAPAAEPEPRPPIRGSWRLRIVGSELRLVEPQPSGEVTLGAVFLPSGPRGKPLLLGRAAYVPLAYGIAVVDIGEPSVPYVAWHLATQVRVRSLAVLGQYLRVETERDTQIYDLRDPLAPRGPSVVALALRRDYSQPALMPSPDAAASVIADLRDRRRLYLRDGRQLTGWLRVDAEGRVLLDTRSGAAPEPIQPRAIVRIEAVHPDSPPLPAEPPSPVRLPGIDFAVERQAAPVAEADWPALAALLDGSPGPLIYRVERQQLRILRSDTQPPQLLGSAALPSEAYSPPVVWGDAAFVLLRQGVAVVDIALARFPYVAWILAPQVQVQSLWIRDPSLLIRSRDSEHAYSLVSTLHTRGAAFVAAERSRCDDGSVTAADATWPVRATSTEPVKHRVYLHDGKVFVRSFRRPERQATGTSGPLRDGLSATEILHAEPLCPRHPTLARVDDSEDDSAPTLSSPAPNPPRKRPYLLGTLGLSLGGPPFIIGGMMLVFSTLQCSGPGTCFRDATGVTIAGLAFGIGGAMMLGGIISLATAKPARAPWRR